jgi:sigma-B regulation protein RsbU (phosphoserine phosphatase)
VQAILCLDARHVPGSRVDSDATSFCASLAWVAGLGLAYIQRMRLEERQKRFMADVEAAQAAQARIMPPEHSSVGPIAYSMRCLPGRGVAGDMFDVIELDDTSAAFYLGDVSGKGMGAAMVMASAQSQLAAGMGYNRDIAHAVTRANAYMARHSSPKEFASLWIARLDAHEGTLSFIDAGHGYAVLMRASGEVERIECEGDIPLGITEAHEFTASSIDVKPGDRVILFSDGAVEERHPESGAEHGWEGVFNALKGSATTGEDVERIFKAVHAWAGSEQLGDDLTVASIEITGS